MINSNIDYKFFNLDSKYGKIIDNYPKHVQNIINEAMDNGKKSIYLGNLYLNATIYFTEKDKLYQTTPKFFDNKNNIYLKPDFREVIKIPKDQKKIRIWRNHNKQWKYYIDNNSILTEIKDINII